MNAKCYLQLLAIAFVLLGSVIFGKILDTRYFHPAGKGQTVAKPGPPALWTHCPAFVFMPDAEHLVGWGRIVSSTTAGIEPLVRADGTPVQENISKAKVMPGVVVIRGKGSDFEVRVIEDSEGPAWSIRNMGASAARPRFWLRVAVRKIRKKPVAIIIWLGYPQPASGPRSKNPDRKESER